MMQKFCILTWRLDAKILRGYFPAKFITKSATKNGSCKNSAFQLRDLDEKFCIAICPLNSLQNQQQIDNAEILRFNFDTCKIWMQKILQSPFPAKFIKKSTTNT